MLHYCFIIKTWLSLLSTLLKYTRASHCLSTSHILRCDIICYIIGSFHLYRTAHPIPQHRSKTEKKKSGEITCETPRTSSLWKNKLIVCIEIEKHERFWWLKIQQSHSNFSLFVRPQQSLLTLKQQNCFFISSGWFSQVVSSYAEAGASAAAL